MQELSVAYEFYGWIYYLSESSFYFAQIGLANFLLLTVTTLSISLKVESLTSESKQILMELG